MNDITFPSPGDGWGNVTHIAVFDGARPLAYIAHRSSRRRNLIPRRSRAWWIAL